MPVATNVVTLAVLVCTTAWSGAHRPLTAPMQASKQQARAVPVVASNTVEHRTAESDSTRLLTADAKAELGVAALQHVGYKPISTVSVIAR